MEDGEGRQIDFRNTVIILTTNVGTEAIMRLTADPETMPTADGLARALRPELDKTFKPAFLGRLVVVPFYPVRDEVLRSIVRLKLARVQRRLFETHRVELLLDDALVATVAARCTEVESGARNVDNILTNTLLPELSRLLLEHVVVGAAPSALHVGVDERGDFTYAASPLPGGALPTAADLVAATTGG
jgi:type VI secretion system protein VasG